MCVDYGIGFGDGSFSLTFSGFLFPVFNALPWFA